MSFNKFHIIPKGRELIATAGQWGLYESMLTLERVAESSANLIRISHQNLLTAESQQSYVDISTAQEKSGLSRNKLLELCKSGKLVAIKSNGKWMVSISSLMKYISRK